MPPYLETVKVVNTSQTVARVHRLKSGFLVVCGCPYNRRWRRHSRLPGSRTGCGWSIWYVYNAISHTSVAKRNTDVLGSAAFTAVQVDLKGNIAVSADLMASGVVLIALNP